MVTRGAAVAVGVVVVAGLACGCSGAARAEPSYVSGDPAAQRDFDEARESFRAGHDEVAAARFQSFIVEHPEDPLRHAAELHLGRIAEARGDHGEASTWLSLAAAAPEPDVSRTAARELGESLLRSGEPGRAIAALEPLAAGTSGDEAEALYATLAEAAAAAGDDERRLAYLDARYRLSHDEPLRAELGEAIADVARRLDVEALERLHSSLPRLGPGWAAVACRLGEEALRLGDEARASTLLLELEAAGAARGPAAAELRSAVEDARLVDWSAIGALLPLSGRARLVGEQARAGLDLAVEGEDGLRLAVRDTAEADVARLVDELVDRDRVAAIVGPMDAAASDVAARRAEERGVPLLTLTIRPGVTGAGRWVFRAFQSNEAEVAALVHHATADLGLRRFAVLYPDGPYGRVVARIAADEVGRQGGTLVVSQGYDPTRTAFVEDARRLAAHDFQALIVPDRARVVALVAPALAAAGLWSQPAGARGGPSGSRPVQILLPAAAFDDSLVPQAGRYLQGAVLATPLWPGGDAPGTVRFVEAWRALGQGEPSAYASQAYDALQVLRAARGAAPRRSREGLLESLLALDAADTAGSFAGFEPSGEPRSPVQLLTVDGEALRAVAP